MASAGGLGLRGSGQTEPEGRMESCGPEEELLNSHFWGVLKLQTPPSKLNCLGIFVQMGTSYNEHTLQLPMLTYLERLARDSG